MFEAVARAVLPHIIFVVVICVPISLQFGGIPNFVTWWCHFSGVVADNDIHVAIGVFSALALATVLYFIWSLFIVLIGLLDALEQRKPY